MSTQHISKINRVGIADNYRCSPTTDENDWADILKYVPPIEAGNRKERFQAPAPNPLIGDLVAQVSALEEALRREQRSSHDLQYVLSNTDVATLYVDDALTVRLFNAATRALFKIASSDIGRELADITAGRLSHDLKADAVLVMETGHSLEREIMSTTGVWHRCRVSPCPRDGASTGGVVITFTDLTALRQFRSAADAAADRVAATDAARIKALDDASHDLRQPLQALSVIQSLLVKAVGHEAVDRLASRLDATLHDLTLIADHMRAAPSEEETAPAEATALVPVAQALADVIFVVDDDDGVRDTICELLESHGQAVEAYATAEGFLAAYKPGRDGCLLVDAHLPGMSGLTLLKTLRERGHHVPAIMITGSGSASTAVGAFKGGVADFLEKPFREADLMASIGRAVAQAHVLTDETTRQEAAGQLIAGLTSRQREVMTLVLAGHPSKNIAADLDLSQRTVENHRAAIMRRTRTKSLPALARLVMAAGEQSKTNRLSISQSLPDA